MRTSSFSKNHPYAKTRGWVSPNRAANSLPTVSDGAGNEVNNASEILVLGGTVTEPADGIAQITLGGSSVGSNAGPGSGGAAPVRVFNSSGAPLLPGYVVVTDPTVDSAVTTTSTASNIRIAGVVQEPIGVAEWGPVLFAGSGGYVSEIVTAGSVSRGAYALTSATAGSAGATAARVAGSFGVYLTGTDMPDFATASVTTELDVADTEFEPDMPSPIPAGRVLFLALWLETGITGVTVPDWTLIGSEANFNYYYKLSTGDDVVEASWTGASVAVATVLLTHPSVSLSDPIESHDYDTSTSAATVAGLSSAVATYALAGVRAEATPGSGFVSLGGGTAGNASSSGTPTLVQSKTAYFDGATQSTSFDSTITEGNVMIAIPFTTNATDTYPTDLRQGPGCPQDVNMTEFGVKDTNLFTQGGRNVIGSFGKTITSDTYSGPFGSPSACSSAQTYMLLMEFSNIGLGDYEVLTGNNSISSPVNLGTFTVGANDLVIMAIGWKKDGYGGTPDPIVNTTGWTQVVDGYAINNGWEWVGYKVGNGAASVSFTNDVGDWAAVAVHLTQGGTSVSGTLAGKYLGHVTSATSPFTGAGAQNDAIFAVNLLQDARASALLYGPDLGGGSALAIGSNSTDVYPTSGLGAGTDYSPSTHHHRGVRQISHASNTFVGDITLTASGTLGITMPTAGTINLSAGTGGGSSQGYSEGTSFPGSPATNDKFYRTDRNLLYYYDGTRWLTVQEFAVAGVQLDAAVPMVTTGGTLQYSNLDEGDNGAYVTRWKAWALIVGTNDGSNYWTIQFRSKSPAGVAHNLGSTVNTSADTAGNSVGKTLSVAAVATSGDARMEWIGTKTGAPSGIYFVGVYYYRLIG